MRAFRWILLAAIASGVVAVAVAAVALVRPDCPSFPELTAAFRNEHAIAPDASEQVGTAPDSRLRDRAESLVRCGHLVGRTPDEIAAELGAPDRRARDDSPRPHSEFAYTLGQDAGSVSNTEIALFMEVDRGKIVYATVDGEGKKVIDGEPVGGGFRGT
jgi:hypothetical protein